MAEASTIAGTAAAATVSAGLSAVPGGEVVAWALMGGFVAVWMSAEDNFAFTIGWMARALARLFVSAGSGVLLSALALFVAPQLPGMGWAAAVPQWVLSGLIAALVFKAAPLVSARAAAWWPGGNKP